MDAEKRIESVQTALQRRFRIAGRGSVNRVQEALSLGAGYFKNQRRAGNRRVDLKVLFRALDVLDVPPAEFFSSVLGTADPVDGFRTDAAVLRRKSRQPPMVLVLEANRVESDARQETDLVALDAMRGTDPHRLMRRAKALVPVVKRSLLPGLLGVYASACRVTSRLKEAQIVLARALELACELDDPAVLADLLQRASYVLAGGGEAEKALEISERATLSYVRAGDLTGVGKTLVDQGIWLGHLQRTEEELSTFESALAYLPETSRRSDVRRNRFSCLMNLGITHRKLGDLEKASRFVGLARALAEEVGPQHSGKLVWLQASIAREAGRFDEAERYYRQALQILRPLVPIDSALTSVELVKVQLKRGRVAEAYQSAKEMTVLVQPLRHNRLAAAAVTELLRCALAGRGLSVAFLDRVARGLEQGRAQRAAPTRSKR